MTTPLIVSAKLLQQKNGGAFSPPDGNWRLGMCPNPDLKETNFQNGIFLQAPATELSHYKDGAYRPASSQGALYTSRNMDPTNALLSTNGVGFKDYNHKVIHTERSNATLVDPGQVERTTIRLPAGKGMYYIWIFVSYDTAEEMDLQIQVSSTTIAQQSFPSTTKYASLGTNYYKSATLAEIVEFTYATSTQFPRIIRTAILKTGDVE